VNILWSAAASAAVIGCLASPARGATRVVFTVDVESNARFTLPDQVDAVCADGSPCGLSSIVRQLRDRQWSGTFFLNVYERQQWGDGAMRKIAVDLEQAGQDVELHTHPQWMYDPSRWAMYQYDADEQTAIISEGVRLLKAWTGRPVVAHRGGAYTADERTLLALERNGVALDSSRLWQDPDSRLESLPRNLPSRYRGVTEIPVSVYQRDDRTRFGAPLGAATVVRKIDPNWFTDADETRSAIEALVRADVPVLVVFLHSFSFMTREPAGSLVSDRHALDMFRVIVETVARRGLPVVTMRQLAKTYEQAPSPSPASDVVPRVEARVSVSRYLWRRAAKSNLGSLAVIAVVVCAGASVIAARRRHVSRARRRTPDSAVQAPHGAPAR
jgi:peptidoglycan/xylan/chitin deacetylase (PgdA/CDA1 family)